MADAFHASIERVKHLERLPRDWNGHGAAPISATARRSAILVLDRTWQMFGPMMPAPTIIAPTTDGGVALEWIIRDQRGEHGVEIVCLAAGDRFEYSVRDRVSGTLQDDLENASLHQLEMLLKTRVLNHPVVASL
jgi:hypothetical protein